MLFRSQLGQVNYDEACITFQTRWVTKNVEMSSLVGFVSRTCSSRHFWGFSKLEQGCPRSWRPEPDPNLIPNVGFPIIASQHFFQKLSSSFGQDVKNLVLDQRSPEFAANSGISGLRTPTNRWFARGSGAEILVPNQKFRSSRRTLEFWGSEPQLRGPRPKQ